MSKLKVRFLHLFGKEIYQVEVSGVHVGMAKINPETNEWAFYRITGNTDGAGFTYAEHPSAQARKLADVKKQVELLSGDMRTRALSVHRGNHASYAEARRIQHLKAAS